MVDWAARAAPRYTAQPMTHLMEMEKDKNDLWCSKRRIIKYLLTLFAYIYILGRLDQRTLMILRNK